MRENNKYIVAERSKKSGDTPGKNAAFTKNYEKAPPPAQHLGLLPPPRHIPLSKRSFSHNH
ncbi:hypothetical protein AAL_02136 [Moelleriella libera RCEF 2490]|uniref:Uncharacterized protein n=1 Tax=Moelleriella libera RCEF 2490 TaxID=1081109 RepID=A0A168F7G1_9HYPO|nr:hypothetical protein AAL_02136 [Moelleriella libera RCEF 2490]